jgi:hypothetical protein
MRFLLIFVVVWREPSHEANLAGRPRRNLRGRRRRLCGSSSDWIEQERWNRVDVGGRPAGKLAPCRDRIIAKVKEQPDITMLDLAAWLLECEGISVDPSNLSKFLCKAGFPDKKNLDGSGAGARRYQARAR